MTTATIPIPVDPATAKAYATAKPEQQQKIRLLLSLCLRELTEASDFDLKAAMDQMAPSAAARGLTDSGLESLLDG